MSQQPQDLFGQPRWPRESVIYPVAIFRAEPMWSPTQGLMSKIIGEIREGEFAGCSVFKPLTHSMKGLEWIDKRIRGCGLEPVVGLDFVYHFAECARRLASCPDLEATLYLYHHPAEGIFPTIETLRRSRREHQANGPGLGVGRQPLATVHPPGPRRLC